MNETTIHPGKSMPRDVKGSFTGRGDSLRIPLSFKQIGVTANPDQSDLVSLWHVASSWQDVCPPNYRKTFTSFIATFLGRCSTNQDLNEGRGSALNLQKFVVHTYSLNQYKISKRQPYNVTVIQQSVEFGLLLGFWRKRINEHVTVWWFSGEMFHFGTCRQCWSVWVRGHGMQEVNKDKSLNLFAPIGGLVAWGFIKVDMVILIHLADPHPHAESATSLTDVWCKAAPDVLTFYQRKVI